MLKLDVEKPQLIADGQDLCYIDISLADERGIVKASEDRLIKIEVERCCDDIHVIANSTDVHPCTKCCDDIHVIANSTGVYPCTKCCDDVSLFGFGNADPWGEEIYTADQCSTYYGHALAVIRAGYLTGKVMVTVSADGCEDKQVTIDVA
jgi:hypothetical protein